MGMDELMHLTQSSGCDYLTVPLCDFISVGKRSSWYCRACYRLEIPINNKSYCTKENITVMPHKRHGVSNHQQLDKSGNIKAPHRWTFVRWIHLWPVESPQKGLIMRRAFPSHEFNMNHMPCSRLLSEILHDQEAEMKPSARRLGDVEVRRLSDLHESSNDAISNIPMENI